MEKFKWVRYVCCFFAIVAIGIVGYDKATEPGSPFEKEHEPSSRRFDHVTFTNASGVEVRITRLIATDQNNVGPMHYEATPQDSTYVVMPGATLSFLFDGGSDLGITTVEVEVAIPGMEPDSFDLQPCAVLVTNVWNITSAKFWVGAQQPDPGTVRVVGEALLCQDESTTRRVIPHGNFTE